MATGVGGGCGPERDAPGGQVKRPGERPARIGFVKRWKRDGMTPIVRNFHPSSRVVSGDIDVTNPTEGELVTHLRAVAAGRQPKVLLERGTGESLLATPGSGPGMLGLSKDKGPGRGVFRARAELPLAVAERVFAAYLAGDNDFDRGLKWEPAAPAAARAVAWTLAAVVSLILAAWLLRACGVG